jgi:hypothetical protein
MESIKNRCIFMATVAVTPRNGSDHPMRTSRGTDGRSLRREEGDTDINSRGMVTHRRCCHQGRDGNSLLCTFADGTLCTPQLLATLLGAPLTRGDGAGGSVDDTGVFPQHQRLV